MVVKWLPVHMQRCGDEATVCLLGLVYHNYLFPSENVFSTNGFLCNCMYFFLLNRHKNTMFQLILLDLLLPWLHCVWH